MDGVDFGKELRKWSNNTRLQVIANCPQVFRIRVDQVTLQLGRLEYVCKNEISLSLPFATFKVDRANPELDDDVHPSWNPVLHCWRWKEGLGLTRLTFPRTSREVRSDGDQPFWECVPIRERTKRVLQVHVGLRGRLAQAQGVLLEQVFGHSFSAKGALNACHGRFLGAELLPEEILSHSRHSYPCAKMVFF